MKILGIACYYHDSSACLLIDGRVHAAAAEERFTRIQHDNQFPSKAIEYCLQSAGLAINELDYIVFYEKPLVKFERLLTQLGESFPKSRQAFVESIPTWWSKLNLQKTLREKHHYLGKILYTPHHLSHAASSYYHSGFDRAVIVTLDGVGEWATTTTGHAAKGKIHLDHEIRFPHSLGLLYSTITAYLGFSVNDSEYKVMGLASYGNPETYLSHCKKLIHSNPDGSFELNREYFAYPYNHHRMFTPKMTSLFGFPPRSPETEIDARHEDLAASLQATLESTVFNLLNHAHQEYKESNLCMAGGVALNSALNGKIVNSTPFTNVFIPPDPGDGGGSMGAALAAHFKLTRKLPSVKCSPYLGPSYPSYQIRQILEASQLKYRMYDESRLIDVVTNYLMNQKVIGWFQGRMEWGPRALGNRSILAAANKKEMKDIINLKVKKREPFRPFAPVILKEHASQYLQDKNQPPSLGKYMLTVLPFTPKGIKTIPATVHVNQTGRPQYIEPQDNPLYYKLVSAYFKKTRIPAIVNTSFNVRGEPIVCTPQDAIQCFLHTEIDYLVLDHYIVSKS